MAQRNFWGWGLEAAAFSDQQLEELRALFAMRFGDALAARAISPPRLQDLALPASRLQPPASLEGLLSRTPYERAAHTYGKAFRDIVRGLQGDFSVAPDWVAYPESEYDLVALMDWAAGAGAAVIPYGGGTTVTGGIEPRFEGGWKAAISVDMSRFNRVLEVDPISRAAHVQAGVYGPALEEALKPHGYSLRHYPQSFEFSTLGGWIATRSGGHFATRYTHIDDFVESLQLLTPQGKIETRRLPGSGAGPSPDKLFIGSEGILGFITSAWMRLQDRPQFRASATVRFTDFLAAAEAARLLAQSGLYPSNCRVIDAQEALNNGIGDGRSNLLLLGFESADHELDAWMRRALEICRECGGQVAEGSGKTVRTLQGERKGAAGTWRDTFLRAPYLRDALTRLGMVVETFETAITWERFPSFHDAVVRAVQKAAAEVCGGCLLTCRFTHVYPDGPAPYYTVIAPGQPGSQISQWDEIKAAASEALITHGGTITHHHSVGRDHRPWYDRQRPDLYAESLRAVKTTLDPAGMLNPGVLLPEQ